MTSSVELEDPTAAPNRMSHLQPIRTREWQSMAVSNGHVDTLNITSIGALTHQWQWQGSSYNGRSGHSSRSEPPWSPAWMVNPLLRWRWHQAMMSTLLPDVYPHLPNNLGWLQRVTTIIIHQHLGPGTEQGFITTLWFRSQRHEQQPSGKGQCDQQGPPLRPKARLMFKGSQRVLLQPQIHGWHSSSMLHDAVHWKAVADVMYMMHRYPEQHQIVQEQLLICMFVWCVCWATSSGGCAQMMLKTVAGGRSTAQVWTDQPHLEPFNSC